MRTAATASLYRQENLAKSMDEILENVATVVTIKKSRKGGSIRRNSLLAGQLYEKSMDTQFLAGSEAYVSALTVYKLTGVAAVAGHPGADSIYRSLKSRFADSGDIATV